MKKIIVKKVSGNFCANYTIDWPDKRFLTPFILVAFILLIGCSQSKNTDKSDNKQVDNHATVTENLIATKLPEHRSASKTLFELISSKTSGIDFVNPIDTSHPMKHLYASSMATGGVTVGDVNGDKILDIYLTSGPSKNKLYLGRGDFKFENVTEKSGVDGGDHWGVGAAMVDIDADGDLDIYVCNFTTENQLFINQGDGTFVEKAKEFHLNLIDASHTPAFCDYDRDGNMDLYLLTNRWYRPEGFPPFNEAVKYKANGMPYVIPKYIKYYMMRQTSDTDWTLSKVGRPDILMRNNGDGTFSDTTSQAKIAGRGHGNSATWWDYNQDGWPDLYVGNDFNEPDHWYRNNGDGTFTDIIKQTVPYTSWFSMGADYADLNNDGMLDLMIADMSATTHYKQKTNMGAMGAEKWFMTNADPQQYMRNVIYMNTGTTRFTEAAFLTGLAKTNWTWTIKFCDFDNDGRQDLFATNGMSRNFNEKDDSSVLKKWPKGKTQWDMYEHLPPLKEKNIAYKNLGDMQFESIGKKWGLDHHGMSYASTHADLDGDGNLDLIVVNLDEQVHLYKNNANQDHKVTIRLHGKKSNRFGVGATLKITTGDQTQVRFISLNRGYLGSGDSLVHFGLGDHQKIDQLVIHWPSGHRQEFKDLAADYHYDITEPAAAIKPPLPTTQPGSKDQLFQPSDQLNNIVHQEKPYNDFQFQPLLAYRHSQLGPGVAWGDIDGDGDDDLYVGGAKAQPGRLYRNDHGRFYYLGYDPFEKDKQSEDLGALFFDADGDGDLDLYVASGSVEDETDSENLADRLYLNQGSGKYKLAPKGTLPPLRDSSFTVVACDYDRDGDLDLFVGSRLIPHKYPLAPNSRLLQNDQGKFTDVTKKVSDNLLTVGLVTGAIWSDADGDGWTDLLISQEWGPIKFYRNQQGQKLVDQTKAAKLTNLSGWYNAIAAADVDADGDMDYVITNVGLNTKYHTSVAKPAKLYYGDFEGKGTFKLVEAEYENNTLFPVRGKSCSTNAMPFLANKFKTYHKFALAPLKDIYTEKCLAEAHQFTANQFQTGILLNDGKAVFKFIPLPRMAQLAPSMGALFTELTGDALPDLILAQNFYPNQLETGRHSGGIGAVLKSSGDGSFTLIEANKTGLIAPVDARGITTTDLNQDGLPDIVISVNNGHLLAFQQRKGVRYLLCEAPAGPSRQKVPDPFSPSKMVNLRLKGKAGNPTAIGAKVIASYKNGMQRLVEIHAGSGYLSQSSAVVSLRNPTANQIIKVEIHWPDGKKTLIDKKGWNTEIPLVTVLQP